MKKFLIDFSETNSFSPVVIDYLSGKDFLKLFYKYAPEISSFKKIIEDKSKEKIDRKLLVEVISEQYAKPETQINLLLDDKTFTVTTGHQLNIFTGPLYFIYKIITTINLADELKRNFPDYNFVPVYWMASEDHDFAEINHVKVFGKKIEWAFQSGGSSPQSAVGRMSCAGVNSLITDLKNILGESENAKQLLALFSRAYNEKNNLADATRILVHELFGKYGLVIIDGDDVKLKKLFAGEMKDDLLNQSSFKSVSKTISELKTEYDVQVNPREINLFYLNESRNRILFENDRYKISDTGKSFSKEEILAELENHPERFSPNVVLRPLYQEKILPNLAYIGGPGEIAYWLEYKKMFEHYKINFPMMVLRNCLMMVDAATSGRLGKFKIKPEEIFQDIDLMIKIFLERNLEENFSLKMEGEDIEKIFSSLNEKINSVDPSLKGTVEAEKQKQLNGIKSLEEKIIRSQKKKHVTSINQIRKIKEKLFPENILQERYENFIPYFLKYGDDFFEMLKSNFKPLEKKFLILQEKNSDQ